MNNNSEIHLFILWENALYKQKEILTKINEKFKIIKMYKIRWSEELFVKNLVRFYGRSFSDCEAKAQHCGKGQFLLIIVKDENPIYEKRDTSSGVRTVNVNLFDSKELFRNMTENGNKIHATNDIIETNHDITLLLNKNIKDFLEENEDKLKKQNKEIEQIEEINKDLFGANGWKDAKEMFYALNNCEKYAILRNYESLPEEIYVNEHNDIDIICESKQNCANILNAEKIFPAEYRVNYRTKVGDKYANFDLRYLGDNYYSENIEKNILEKREFNEKGFYTLNSEDYYYTLLYHAIIHKKTFKPDYKTRLIQMNKNKITENTDLEEMVEILKKWLEKNKYLITIPKDKSVEFNIENVYKFKPLLEFEQTNNILKIFNANIIKWYPFENLSNILLIGENEEIEKHLKTITDKLTIISRFEKISENIEKNNFDYILINGIEKYKNIIPNLKELLKQEGKFIILGNNTFGINNWSKYNINENIAINKLENNNLENITVKKIKHLLKQNDLKQTNTFYVFPNYQETELIINEKFNIKETQIEKYVQNIKDTEIKTFDEIKILKNIIKEQPEMLEFFTNSFFIEASKEEIKTDIKYVSYNNCRNEKYRLITLIKKDIVKKIPANNLAKQQIQQMCKTIENVKKCGIDILDYEENEKIYSKLITNEQTLDEILAKKSNNLEEIIKIIEQMKNILLNNSIPYQECKDKIKYKDLEESKLQELHFLKNAFWDMICKNCFYINNKFIFFDQEWEKEYLPVEFIIYRSIINCYDLVIKINVEEILQKLNILQYKKYFEEIDKDIRKEIINEEIFKEMYCKEIKGIDNLINDNIINEEKIQLLEQNMIKPLQEDNRKKQNYIETLEQINRKNQEEIINNKNNRKNFFWRK